MAGVPKVVFIMGAVRSGSTLLANLVGHMPGAFAAGELRFIWSDGLRHGRTCGCGQPIEQCDVWAAVLANTFGARLPDRAELDALAADQHRLLRLRGLPSLLRAGRDARPARRSLDGRIQRYAELTERTYRSISDATGAKVVVDSSKKPGGAALLALLDVEAYCVHLVRDSRAVVHSEQRHKAQLDPSGPAEMRRRNVYESALHWTRANLGSDIVRSRSGLPSLFLRYEDFIASPRATLERVATFIGEPPVTGMFLDDHEVDLHPTHTVAGNADRFRTGRVALRADNAWHDGLDGRAVALTTAITAPLLRRYGYPLRRADALLTSGGPHGISG